MIIGCGHCAVFFDRTTSKRADEYRISQPTQPGSYRFASEGLMFCPCAKTLDLEIVEFGT